MDETHRAPALTREFEQGLVLLEANPAQGHLVSICDHGLYYKNYKRLKQMLLSENQ